MDAYGQISIQPAQPQHVYATPQQLFSTFAVPHLSEASLVQQQQLPSYTLQNGLVVNQSSQVVPQNYYIVPLQEQQIPVLASTGNTNGIGQTKHAQLAAASSQLTSSFSNQSQPQVPLYVVQDPSAGTQVLCQIPSSQQMSDQTHQVTEQPQKTLQQAQNSISRILSTSTNIQHGDMVSELANSQQLQQINQTEQNTSYNIGHQMNSYPPENDSPQFSESPLFKMNGIIGQISAD